MMMQTIHSSRAVVPRGHRRGRRVAGFTLVEMLVVIGIIVLLISIALPALIAARRRAMGVRMASDLVSISAALSAYKQDLGDYPRAALTNGAVSWNEAQGSGLLGRALISPDPIVDGAAGPGFRLRAGSGQASSSGQVVGSGQVYGPYLPPDKFKCQICGPYLTVNGVANVPLGCQILDINGMPILYSPARVPPPPLDTPINTGGTTTYPPFSVNGQEDSWALFYMPPEDVNQFCIPGESGSTVFNAAYNQPNTYAYDRIQMMLGDFTVDGASTNFDGIIEAGEHPATTGPFILWCAGPDGQFGFPKGTPNTTPLAKDMNSCDDVTNFSYGVR